MARSTVFRFKGADPQKTGRDLNVRAVLTGRVLQRGDTLSIRTELVDAADGSQLWGGQYNRKLAEIFSVQEEIATEISGKLRLRLTGEEQKRLTKRYTENKEAYQLYLKGHYYWDKLTKDGLQKAIESYRQAIEKDPGYALAYAGLAECYAEMSGNYLSPREGFPKAKEAAYRAVELDDTLAEAHVQLGNARALYDWDWTGGEKEFRRALELNAGNAAWVHDWYGYYLGCVGRPEEGIPEIKRALELDPLSATINGDLGFVLYLAHRYDDSIEQSRKAIEIDPTYFNAHGNLGTAYEMKGQLSEAIAAFQKAAQLEDNPWITAGLGHAYARSGRRAEAMNMLDRMKKQEREKYISPYFIAYIHLGMGEKDQALASLERAYEDRSIGLFWIKVDPVFDPLRPDPRFQNLLKRIGLQ